MEVVPWSPADQVRPPSDARPVVAIAAGRAFTFRYVETEELLRAAGCEPVVFDPVADEQLPAATAGLYLGGGFPEMHAAELAANAKLRSEIRAAVAAGLPTVAECAGLIYLCRSVDGLPMVGAIEADAIMSQRLTLSYRTMIADHDQLLATAGARLTGHEFHRTRVEPDSGVAPAWLVDGKPVGFSADPGGADRETLHASYLHLHWAGHPDLAQRFAEAVHEHANRRPEQPISRPEHAIMPPEPLERRQSVTIDDLHHHGDRDIAEGLIDLAVNVRLAAPPDWLSAIINSTTEHLAAYPNTDAATKAIAEAHNVAVDQVLPTAGGAEAFTLLAHAFRPSSPLIIHPQFTEPEAALLAAGHRPQRLILSPTTGFRLDVDLVPADADLVVIGNPTNPTSVLHPRPVIDSLRRTERLVIVDEAFMDAVPGETETMISDELTGVLVLRSLTKTWGLAGLRAGYVIGDPMLIAAMRSQQPPWSVSTPALAAMVACLTPEARALAAVAAREIASQRSYLVEQLANVGLNVACQPHAPFVLVDTSGISDSREPGWIRLALRDHGFAVRRGETFPGLTPDWIRIAVREPEVTDHLASAFGQLVSMGGGAEGGAADGQRT
jgi:cobyrinic acid a,c-diamide synthase